jgi:exopolysaccharide production protein ExoZ
MFVTTCSSPDIDLGRRMPRIQSIQYLRAVAAIMVVFFHATYTTSPQLGLIGAAGVDVFFVISGFIVWSVSVRQETSPRSFLLHRFIRVAPLYWFYTSIIAGSAALVPSAFPNLPLSAANYVNSILFIPYRNALNGDISPLLVQGWTLTYEVFFYALLAAALILPFRARLGTVASALIILPIVGLFIANKSAAEYVFTNPLLVEFLAGVAIALAFTQGFLPSLKMSVALLVLALAGFLWAASSAAPGEQFRLVAWGGPSMVLVLALVSIERAGFLPAIPGLSLVGDASYSIYLTHGFFLSLAHKVRAAPGDFKSTFGFSLMAFMAVVACVIAGILAYRMIEKPLLRWLRDLAFAKPRTLPA